MPDRLHEPVILDFTAGRSFVPGQDGYDEKYLEMQERLDAQAEKRERRRAYKRRWRRRYNAIMRRYPHLTPAQGRELTRASIHYFQLLRRAQDV